jgi:hypothetical protein
VAGVAAQRCQRCGARGCLAERVELRLQLVGLRWEDAEAGPLLEDVPDLPKQDPGAGHVGERKMGACELEEVWTARWGMAEVSRGRRCAARARLSTSLATRSASPAAWAWWMASSLAGR